MQEEKRCHFISTILNELILPPIFQLDMQLEKAFPYKSCGTTYSLLPEAGKGYYWVYGYSDQFAVVVYNMSFKKTITSVYEHPAFYSIGSYDNTTARLVSCQMNTSARTLLGYSRPKEIWKEVLYKGYTGKGVSISLLEPYARKMAGFFDISIQELAQRCFCLDGTARIPEADIILKQLESYTPTERYAHHYYESKLVELLTVLCQQYESAPLFLPKKVLPKNEAENLSRVTDYINAHYTAPVDLDVLSSTAYMGRTKLSLAFKQMYGITITQYVRQLRVEHAKSLLKNKELSLGEIAAQVGYQTQGSFTDLFKEATGLTPREYRHLFY
ncbi:helix-turn-helix domain-containing protein [Anaerocolumna xylanovorans]|uniref:AraC-type DNA-binding protein n=1 Tax=Anaerocolumna xylanovorans DSM 12503 TaxID=1121345 RepID=A0A1M7YLY8_9FIRM|nr:AraC family transcriptional regulator [Anaerocolumna xylanovorans]SHO53645.1 AraC-type DNA-binding protein [Anaerocolumna xylanovorans DSM 12503]